MRDHMSQDVLSVIRRIRACEGEVTARVVLEHFLSVKCDEAYEKSAQVCESISGNEPSGDRFGALDCAQAIRALKSGNA